MAADPSGYSYVPDASSAYDYWMNVAVDGESEGGLGSVKAFGACLMTSCIDYFGARNVQRDATASDDEAGNGKTGGAIGYGVFAGVEIGLAATAGWTGGGGAGAVGVRLNEVGLYELGSQSIRGDVYRELAAQGPTNDKVMLGRLLVSKYGFWNVFFHTSSELRPASADWRITFAGGPTPAAYMGVTAITRGGQQLLTSHCPEDWMK